MTAKRWLGTLARHYPSLLVSGVCHKALGEIEELEAKLAIAVEALEGIDANGWHEDQCPAAWLSHHKCDCGYSNAIAALAKIKETK